MSRENVSNVIQILDGIERMLKAHPKRCAEVDLHIYLGPIPPEKDVVTKSKKDDAGIEASPKAEEKDEGKRRLILSRLTGVLSKLLDLLLSLGR